MSRLRLVFILSVMSITTPFSLAGEPALGLFEQRIMPIFNSPKPSSCIQCHLASVDLKDYIRPSHEETFLSLRDQGLIDVKSPADSKILKLIRMGDADSDLQAKRIHEKNRIAELEAFAAWIDACCQDEQLVSRQATADSARAKPATSVQVIRHARKDRLLDSFVRNVWSQRMRCFPCHTPGEIDPENNPQHKKAKQRYDDFVTKYGRRMNLFDESPSKTMNAMLRSSRRSSSKHLPMLNFEDPAQSLLLLKPTARLPKQIVKGEFEKPSSLPPVTHMGGLKMHKDDVSYKAVFAWIRDAGKIESGGYESASELPEDNWFPTQHVVRLKDLPETWQPGTNVQLFLHAATEGGGWSKSPVAFTQTLVTPRRFAGGPMVMIREADREDTDAWDPLQPHLTADRYLVKVFADTGSQIKQDATVILGVEDLRGEIELSGPWEPGFKNAKVLVADSLQAP